MADELIIFTRTFDLLVWLLPKSEDFPRAYRYTLTQRMMTRALDFQEALVDANRHRNKTRLSHLRRADAHLLKLRLYLRLAHRLKWLSDGQYRHVSVMTEEIGRLLGGWIRQTERA